MNIDFPKEHSYLLDKYNITKEFNKNKSFLLGLEKIPEFIYGISNDKKYWFLAEGNGGLYNFKAYKTKSSLLSLNEIHNTIKSSIKYDFIIGYKKEIPKYLAKHPISGKTTEWKNEKEYIEFILKSGRRCPEMESSIAKDSEYSYKYAVDIIKGRFELGEPAIAKDSEYSYKYARDIIKGRWPEAEVKIVNEFDSNDLNFSQGYAFQYLRIINKRWIELENKIIEFGKRGSLYISRAAVEYIEIVKERIPELESVIAKDGHDSLTYAKYVIHGRFELGEPAIAKNDAYAYEYAKDVIKGRFELGEFEMLDNYYYGHGHSYMRDIIKERFVQAEPLIIEQLFYTSEGRTLKEYLDKNNLELKIVEK